MWQVVATFCVLNLVVAILLNAFTWCYSLEPSEITAGLVVNSAHLLHFKVSTHTNKDHILFRCPLQKIWDRFDTLGTGFVDLNVLQFMMAVIQYNIPELCSTGEVDVLHLCAT